MIARTLRPLTLGVALLLAVPGGAAGSVAGLQDVDLDVSLEMRYDDNVFEYGDGYRAAFDPALEGYRGLSSLEDWILAPGVRIGYRHRAAYDTRVSLAGSWKFYDRNGVKDYQSYSLRVAQELPADMELTLRYLVVPGYYFKRLADPANQTTTYADAEFRIDSLRASLDRGFAPGFDLEAWGEFRRNDYRAPFDNRDITKLEGGLGLSARVGPRVRVRARAGVGEGVAAGENDPAVNSDTSYTGWTASIAPEFRVSDRVSVSVGYTREQKRFTTDLGRDRVHWRRRDVSDTVEAGVRVRLGGGFTLEAGLEHGDTRSERDGARLDFSTFKENLYTVQVSYGF